MTKVDHLYVEEKSTFFSAWKLVVNLSSMSEPKHPISVRLWNSEEYFEIWKLKNIKHRLLARSVTCDTTHTVQK